MAKTAKKTISLSKGKNLFLTYRNFQEISFESGIRQVLNRLRFATAIEKYLALCLSDRTLYIFIRFQKEIKFDAGADFSLKITRCVDSRLVTSFETFKQQAYTNSSNNFVIKDKILFSGDAKLFEEFNHRVSAPFDEIQMDIDPKPHSFNGIDFSSKEVLYEQKQSLSTAEKQDPLEENRIFKKLKTLQKSLKELPVKISDMIKERQNIEKNGSAIQSSHEDGKRPSELDIAIHSVNIEDSKLPTYQEIQEKLLQLEEQLQISNEKLEVTDALKDLFVCWVETTNNHKEYEEILDISGKTDLSQFSQRIVEDFKKNTKNKVIQETTEEVTKRLTAEFLKKENEYKGSLENREIEFHHLLQQKDLEFQEKLKQKEMEIEDVREKITMEFEEKMKQERACYESKIKRIQESQEKTLEEAVNKEIGKNVAAQEMMDRIKEDLDKTRADFISEKKRTEILTNLAVNMIRINIPPEKCFVPSQNVVSRDIPLSKRNQKVYEQELQFIDIYDFFEGRWGEMISNSAINRATAKMHPDKVHNPALKKYCEYSIHVAKDLADYVNQQLEEENIILKKPPVYFTFSDTACEIKQGADPSCPVNCEE